VKRHRVQVFRESHATPTWAAAILTQSGGLNLYGEPLFRAVWSNNRLAWCAGRFEDRDNSGHLVREVLAARLMPKYPVESRWIIEQWLPAEKYGSRDNWWQNTREWGEEGNLPQLGPYPSRGDYELACLLETRVREFVQLEHWIIQDFFWQLKLAKMRSYAENVRRHKAAMAREKQEFKQYSHEYLNEQTMPVANDGMMVNVL
jgi:hypothetical protein